MATFLIHYNYTVVSFLLLAWNYRLHLIDLGLDFGRISPFHLASAVQRKVIIIDGLPSKNLYVQHKNLSLMH